MGVDGVACRQSLKSHYNALLYYDMAKSGECPGFRVGGVRIEGGGAFFPTKRLKPS